MREADARRFWRRVRKGYSCWEWTGARNQKGRRGYGRITIGRKADGTRRAWLAHRVAWQLAYGPIPDGLFVCHHCDNPACVRPDHLFLGDQAANMSDCARKGRARGPSLRGTRNPNASYGDDVVARVRALAAAGVPRAEIRLSVGASKSWVAYVIRGVQRAVPA